MANWQSVEYALQANTQQSVAGLAPYQYRGRVRISTFLWTVAAGTAAGDTLQLCLIPVNARVLRGYLQTSGLGAGVTAAISDGTLSYLPATSVAAAGEVPFANTIGNSSMAIPVTDEAVGTDLAAPVDTLLTLTFGGGNPTAAQTVQGYVMWCID
jgi:hypothetical protein